MLRSNLARLLFLASLGLASSVRAQFDGVKDQPFEAIVTRTDHRDGLNYTVSYNVARKSDGSYIDGVINPQTGAVDGLLITDVSGQRNIYLDLKRKWYSVNPMRPPNDRANWLAEVESAKKVKVGDVHHIVRKDGSQTDEVQLGTRLEDGFTEYGRRYIFVVPSPNYKGEDHAWENWYLPVLSVVAENIAFDAQSNIIFRKKLTNIRAKEPDVHLFEIPPDFTPRPQRSPGRN